MSDPSETTGRPLASDIQQPEALAQPPSLRRKRTTSQSSDDRVGGTKSSASRRRASSKKESAVPHTGSSRGESSTMQRSTSPAQMSPEMSGVNYTRTGRISKAKKGLKVHNCECGRSYTRAEHLRRHQKNHAPSPLVCELPSCGKTFFRIDLLQRHQERHNELDKDGRRPSYISEGTAPDAEPEVSTSPNLPPPIVTTLPQEAPPYYQPAVSPLPETTTPPSHMKHGRMGAHQTSMSISVPVDGGMPTIMPWHENSFSHSPNYSSSSGYASPVPGATDYANMFANHPYGSASNRTRTSSDASFVEPWGYTSRSPTSATSTTAFTWTSNDKMAPASLAYMNATSYPLTSMPMPAGVDPMGGFGNFGPKSMAQRDEEEQAYLFPEHSFGMGLADTLPFEQYLDNYWRMFHPSFPIVHRATFERINESPMLRAAMIATGAQYSNDPSAKRKSRTLHDRCLKLLDKRDLAVMTEPERLCDYQALFLIEVISQYRARRAATALSARFETVYHRFSQNFRIVASRIIEILGSVIQPENTTYELWAQWIDLAGQQRLLQCCYILEYQQAVLLARQPQHSMFQYAAYDLPFPSHSSLWSAENPMDWAIAAQQYPHFPTSLFEIAPDMNTGPFDDFQSLLLIAFHYNHFSNPATYLSPPAIPAIDHLINESPRSKHALLTAKLSQVTPIRALLAVSGESWIIQQKVPTAAAFQGFRSTLKAWLSGLWIATPDQNYQAVKDALKLSIELLQHAIATPAEDFHLELGADMGFYLATLVIWTVTLSSNTRINGSPTPPQPIRFQSQSPISPSHNLAASSPQFSANPAHPAATGLMHNAINSPVQSPTSSTAIYSQFPETALSFLENAQREVDFLGVVPQWPCDISYWQQGCLALMRWVKTRLLNGVSFGRDSVIGDGSTTSVQGRDCEGPGEHLSSIIAVLDKILGRSWDGWGI